MLAANIQQFYCFEVFGEMLDRLITMFGHPTSSFRMLDEIWLRSKMLAADIQQFYCFEVFGEMLYRLPTSAKIVGSVHAQFAK